MAAAEQNELRDVVARAANRDPDAWEWLYRRSHPKLFAYARRRLSSAAAAEEAVSETMTRALEKIETFSWRGAGFDGWMYGILRNVVLEQHRRGGRERRGEETTAEAVAVEGNPVAIAERGDRRQTLKAAFELLSDEDRELLELRVVGELSSEQTAEVLGKKAGAVRMAQARALERLREHVEGIESV